jgi:uncharacterized damage-inducible protein DinB
MILETKEKAGITNEALLANWQGHRTLTRKTIDAFPEKELFEYSVGGMRPFAEIIMELVMIAEEGMNGILTGKWKTFEENTEVADILGKKSKAVLLEKWDQVTAHINEIWPQLEDEHFLKYDKAFGAYENTNLGTITYAYDNEIHHRGQGFVYLRTLGIQPPFFWDRY